MFKSNKLSPKIYIGISTKNSAATIYKTLKSLVEQDFTNWEAGIIDGNSLDDTIEICQKFSEHEPRINIIQFGKESTWPESSIKHLDRCESEYFMWLDGDDYISKNWLSSLANVLEKNSGFVAAFGICKVIDEQDLELNVVSNSRIYKGIGSKFKFIRLSSYLVQPENLGLVNLTYSLWRTSCLRNLVTWRQKPLFKNFDAFFIYRCLFEKRIIQLDYTSIYRRVAHTRSEIFEDKSIKVSGVSFLVRRSIFFNILSTDQFKEEYFKINRELTFALQFTLNMIIFSRSALRRLAIFIKYHSRQN